MTAQATILDGVTLREVRAMVFRRQEATLDQEAAEYDLADWERALTHYSARTRDALHSLPEHAFKAQPNVIEDGEVWSAGAIVRHTLETQVNIFFKTIREIAGVYDGRSAAELVPIPEGADVSRAEALVLLDTLERDIDALFRSLPPGVDVHGLHEMEGFGSIGIGGAFMISAIHAEDHAAQLRELM